MVDESRPRGEEIEPGVEEFAAKEKEVGRMWGVPAVKRRRIRLIRD